MRALWAQVPQPLQTVCITCIRRLGNRVPSHTRVPAHSTTEANHCSGGITHHASGLLCRRVDACKAPWTCVVSN